METALAELAQLIGVLSVGSLTERLAAARALSLIVGEEHIERLRTLRRNEADPWVRAAIDDAIGHAKRGAAEIPHGLVWRSAPPPQELNVLEAEALNNATRMLVHEARPLVQALELAALAVSDERTDGLLPAIGRLRQLLETFERLANASARPHYYEFDLRDCVLSATANCCSEDADSVIVRSEPLVVRGDEQLLLLALTPLIRNAIEATSSPYESPVIINFGQSEAETWVVVLDEGSGLPPGDPFRPGQTSKSKKTHFGFGLTIARRAVHSFDGHVSLAPRATHGTAAEIRWSLPIEEDAE